MVTIKDGNSEVTWIEPYFQQSFRRDYTNWEKKREGEVRKERKQHTEEQAYTDDRITSWTRKRDLRERDVPSLCRRLPKPMLRDSPSSFAVQGYGIRYCSRWRGEWPWLVDLYREEERVSFKELAKSGRRSSPESIVFRLRQWVEKKKVCSRCPSRWQRSIACSSTAARNEKREKGKSQVQVSFESQRSMKGATRGLRFHRVKQRTSKAGHLRRHISVSFYLRCAADWSSSWANQIQVPIPRQHSSLSYFSTLLSFLLLFQKFCEIPESDVHEMGCSSRTISTFFRWHASDNWWRANSNLSEEVGLSRALSGR